MQPLVTKQWFSFTICSLHCAGEGRKVMKMSRSRANLMKDCFRCPGLEGPASLQAIENNEWLIPKRHL